MFFGRPLNSGWEVIQRADPNINYAPAHIVSFCIPFWDCVCLPQVVTVVHVSVSRLMLQDRVAGRHLFTASIHVAQSGRCWVLVSHGLRWG